MPADLPGMVLLITGAARGIGEQSFGSHSVNGADERSTGPSGGNSAG